MKGARMDEQQVQLVDVTVQVPKEMKDVKDFLVKLLEDIKAKKSITEIAAGSLPGLITAVDGFEKLDDEAKAKESYNLYGLLVADVAKALAGK